jgi:transcriptional regulator with XRE-family HTH domain
MSNMKEELILRSVGQRLRQAREKRMLSLEDAADGADMSASFLGKVERGENSPSVITFFKLVKMYKVSADAFLDDIRSYDERLDCAYKKLTKKQKDVMNLGAYGPEKMDYKSKKALVGILEGILKE